MTARPDIAQSHAPHRIHLRERTRHVQRMRALVASVPAVRLAAFGIGADTGSPQRLKLRRNAYATAAYSELSWQDQLIVMACAVQDATDRDPLFSHVTAAAIWGLPMIGSRCELVEYTLPPDARGRTPNVRRRRTEQYAAATNIGGLRVTTYERTVIDHARHAKLASAIAVCDNAFHEKLTTRDRLQAEFGLIPRAARGCRMAELAIHLADGRAESPLESLSRTRMFQTGLPRPDLQSRFEDGSGFVGRTDFYWPALGLIGEADGGLKYAVTEGDSGRDTVEALLREKKRERRLRQLPEIDDVARWDWDDALPPGKLHAVLAGFGLRTVLDGGWPLPDGPLPKRAFVP